MRNPVGQKLRHAALLMALEDMEAWLETGGFSVASVWCGGFSLASRSIWATSLSKTMCVCCCLVPSPAEGSQVAVLDATNSTEERRNFLRSRFHGGWRPSLELAGTGRWSWLAPAGLGSARLDCCRTRGSVAGTVRTARMPTTECAWLVLPPCCRQVAVPVHRVDLQRHGGGCCCTESHANHMPAVGSRAGASLCMRGQHDEADCTACIARCSCPAIVRAAAAPCHGHHAPPWVQVLENNYRLKMMYSPDYKGQDMEPALAVSARLGQIGGCLGISGSGGIGAWLRCQGLIWRMARHVHPMWGRACMAWHGIHDCPCPPPSLDPFSARRTSAPASASTRTGMRPSWTARCTTSSSSTWSRVGGGRVVKGGWGDRTALGLGQWWVGAWMWAGGPPLKPALPAPARAEQARVSKPGMCPEHGAPHHHTHPSPHPSGRGYMDVNRISGYLPGKMVFFLMQARSTWRGGACGCVLARGGWACTAVFHVSAGQPKPRSTWDKCCPVTENPSSAPAPTGVPRGRGAAPQDLAHAARREPVQHAGQDWRQFDPQVPVCWRVPTSGCRPCQAGW